MLHHNLYWKFLGRLYSPQYPPNWFRILMWLELNTLLERSKQDWRRRPRPRQYSKCEGCKSETLTRDYSLSPNLLIGCTSVYGVQSPGITTKADNPLNSRVHFCIGWLWDLAAPMGSLATVLMAWRLLSSCQGYITHKSVNNRHANEKQEEP